MKKIAIVLGLFFIFSLSALAQEIKKEDARILAKKEISALMEVIELDNQIVGGMLELLAYKHEAIAKNPEKKKEVSNLIEDKLKGTLTPEQFIKVKSNKKLFEDLIN